MRKIILGILVLFLASYFMSDLLKVRTSLATTLSLPEPDQILHVSKQRSMPVLKGIKLDPQNPENIEFFIDTQDKDEIANTEAQKLINYFFAGLTINDENLWVNLSPYEKDRVMDDALSVTELGEDLLGQDYILKQLSASLTFPNTELGKQYWSAVGAQHAAPELNKIWISPEKAEIYVEDNYVFVTDALLKVESENEGSSSDVLLDKITEQVNHGEHFSKLRQIYNSLILARWFKQNFFESFYTNYIDQNNVSGIDSINPDLKQKVYKLYCEAFQKGAYNFIAKEKNPNKEIIKRKYFSGGVNVTNIPTMASSIKRFSELPIVGELYRVAGNVVLETTSKIFKPNLMRKVVFLTGLIAFNTFAQMSALEAEIEMLSLETELSLGLRLPKPSLEGWDPLQNYMLDKLEHPLQKELVTNIISRVKEEKVPLVLTDDHKVWKNILAERNASPGVNAFVTAEGAMYIYLNYARPNLLFHELIHIFQKNDAAVYRMILDSPDLTPRDKDIMINKVPMFDSFNKMDRLIGRSDDAQLKAIYKDIIEHLVYDYSNPLKKIWYNQRRGNYGFDEATYKVLNMTKGYFNAEQAEEMLDSDEYFFDRMYSNKERGINEFFAFIYGVAIAYDLGFGQDELSDDAEKDIFELNNGIEMYRIMNVEKLVAKFIYALKRHPIILNQLKIYYQNELKMPVTNAFKADPDVTGNYSQGIVDDSYEFAKVAEYYEFAENDSLAIELYNKAITSTNEDELFSGFGVEMYKRLANLYLKYKQNNFALQCLEQMRLIQSEIRAKNGDDLNYSQLINHKLGNISVLIGLGQRTDALKYLNDVNDFYENNKRKLIRIDRVNIDMQIANAYAAVGDVYMTMRSFKKLKRDVRRLGDPAGQRDAAELVMGAARQLAEHNFHAEAQKVYEQSLKHYQDTVDVQRKVLDMYLLVENYPATVDYLEDIIRDTDNPAFYYQLADIYYHEIHDSDKAVSVLKRLIKKFPDDVRAKAKIIEIYSLDGDRVKMNKFISDYQYNSTTYNGGIDLMDINLVSVNGQQKANAAQNTKFKIISLKYHIESIKTQNLAALGAL